MKAEILRKWFPVAFALVLLLGAPVTAASSGEPGQLNEIQDRGVRRYVEQSRKHLPILKRPGRLNTQFHRFAKQLDHLVTSKQDVSTETVKNFIRSHVWERHALVDPTATDHARYYDASLRILPMRTTMFGSHPGRPAAVVTKRRLAQPKKPAVPDLEIQSFVELPQQFGFFVRERRASSQLWTKGDQIQTEIVYPNGVDFQDLHSKLNRADIAHIAANIASDSDPSTDDFRNYFELSLVHDYGFSYLKK